LDTKVTAQVFECITNHPDLKEKTFIVSSNDYKLLEYSHRVIYMKEGRILFNGSPEEYKNLSFDFNYAKYLANKKALPKFTQDPKTPEQPTKTGSFAEIESPSVKELEATEKEFKELTQELELEE
jgi:ABC-type multidrug transport system ATPase subunit